MTSTHKQADPREIAPNGEPKKERFANSHKVWDAAVELRNTERRINRRALADITDLTPGIVDDHVERFIERGQMRRAGKGDLEIIECFPLSRAITKTTLPNGLVKLEIGNEVLDLTPTEARLLARDMAGHMHELAETDAANKGVVLAYEVARELKEARKRIAALERLVNLAPEAKQAELELV